VGIYDSYDDCFLLALLKEGDESAFNEIYARYWRRLYNECYRRLHDNSWTSDILQDVFSDLWLSRATRKIDNLAAYLSQSARYQVFLLYKKHKRIPTLDEAIEVLAGAAQQTDNLFFEKELLECIAIWLDMQPEKRKEVFKLRFINDRSTREISELLNVSQKTVQNQFTTSLKSLRAHLTRLIMFLL
jgi:RNA polymerase sigma factor (sigma-70 family)